MAKRKKEVEAAAADAAAQQSERLSTIRDFNMNSNGEFWIDPNKVPTEDDVAAAKKDFEDAVEALQNKKDYLVADEANALRVAEFLHNFIHDGFWSGQFFRGVVNFEGYITGFINECMKKPKALVMEYGPMQFCEVMLENFIGKGYDDAAQMAEIWDEYVPIYDTLKDHTTWYEGEIAKIKKLQQRWGLFTQGYYAVILSEDGTGDPAAQGSCDADVAAPADSDGGKAADGGKAE